MTARFHTRRDRGLEITLSPAEVELLRSLPEELRALYESPRGTDAAHARLFPPAYFDPVEREAEQEWQAAIHPELLRQRLEALDALTRTLDGVEERRGRMKVILTAEQVDAWLAVLNDARLTLGVRLNITEDFEPVALDPANEEAAAYAAYAWLTYLEDEMVQALIGETF
ncbi:MAG: DUF2017 family protein [Actinobacteria bacterium]|nr:MAG: DUF2017 family protein [Actinomycetota bacterium]